MSHTFHIPVLGLGYSIDTPLKVARYGIDSTVSIVDDELIERMRAYHSLATGTPYTAITRSARDSRAQRIRAYLNLVDELVNRQFDQLRQQPFEPGQDICRYFELLPDNSQLKQGYELMMDYPESERKTIFQNILRRMMRKGNIDVNIMAKLDKLNFGPDGAYLGDEYTDALAALRGFAQSDLRSAVVISAGMNPKLYSYLESFEVFLPDVQGHFQKKVILKVSDHRSALIQAKFLAKKGLWVSEFRIESGLNCGGHAFATEGYLMGPILAEFKERRAAMREELFQLYLGALAAKGIRLDTPPAQRLSVQGGIGTAEENNFLMAHYGLDGTGWGSPFLLVPEATSVDEDTLLSLAGAQENDYYLSNSSPLGVLFNNFKGSTIESQRLARLAAGKPGSPCTKKYLCSNTEFTKDPICTASSKYQQLKIASLQAAQLPASEYEQEYRAVTEKACLCEGLCASTYIKYGIGKPRENKAVAICPGPNLAYFSRTYSLDEMVHHIYGRKGLLDNTVRPHVFIKELTLYLDYFQQDLQAQAKSLTVKKLAQLTKFKEQLENGIAYYQALYRAFSGQSEAFREHFLAELSAISKKLSASLLPQTA